MKKVVIGFTCALLLTTTPVLATPSVNGPTGLINSPSADVLRSGQLSLGYYHFSEGGTLSITTNVAPNLELGVSAFRYDGQDNKKSFNAKFAVAPESVLSPGLAIGVEDIASHDKPSIYAVASKALPFGFRLHVGAGDGRFNGVFAGIEKTINPINIKTGNSAFPATTLIAEYDGKTVNYGARMSIKPGLKLDAGIRNHNSYVGLSFTN